MGKPEAALEQLRVTTHDVKEQRPRFMKQKPPSDL